MLLPACNALRLNAQLTPLFPHMYATLFITQPACENPAEIGEKFSNFDAN